MKVGMYALWNLTWDGSTLNGPGYCIRYIRGILATTGGVRLFCHTEVAPAKVWDESIAHPNLEIIALPATTYHGTYLHLYQFVRAFSTNVDGLDAMYVRLWDPCAWVVGQICRRRKIGVVFHVVGDPIAGIVERDDWCGLRKAATLRIFGIEEFLVRQSMPGCHVLINGTDNTVRFMRRGMIGNMVIESCLVEDDYFQREDTCRGNIIRLLFVGYLRRPKRVEVFLIGAAQLMSQHPEHDVCLRIVGGCDHAGYQDELASLARRLGLAERVTFVGHVPFGAPLLAEYRNADIFVFPSVSEGSARVLLEAAANSLPIVATKVGGADDVFADARSALLVAPNDPDAIAEGIQLLIVDQQFRRHCIREAHRIARTRTAHQFVDAVVNALESVATRYR